ncbi:3-dehydroquinate synthase family protein [Nocardia sp. R7R-8]|uniref:3-dehydroquinate synthase family protein n=1 Tax=Nocardia sp. R7R-8 TaxID=3459304 RepID=UPI00403E2C90
MRSTLERHHSVTFSRSILNPNNPVLRDCIDCRDALIVCTPSVDRLYGRQIHSYVSTLSKGARSKIVVVPCTESTKSIHAAVEVCEHAAAAGSGRTSPIVAIGGGVCTDVVGLAAALHHRGVPHIKVPTTLIGIIDAGIGIKNAVNLAGRKSGLGTFHPPEHSLLDPAFLRTLPDRHIRNGMAEIAKVAIIGDRSLFDLLTEHGRDLVDSRFSSLDDSAAVEVLRLSVAGMLSELSSNLFETADYRRRMDFGHTFSPYTEVASNYTVLHGEAVAMDIALSTQIANSVGLLSDDDSDDILSLLEALGLALTWPSTSIDDLWASLHAITEHRNGDLHLVVPAGIASCQYLGLDVIGPALLSNAQMKLSRRTLAEELSSHHAAS